MVSGNFFSTKSGGVGGQLKRRYSDFIVEEILESGRVCEATRFLGKSEPAQLRVPPREDERAQSQLLVDLEKINRDQNFCISVLSRRLGCSRKRFGYAGLKDKRAITCQRISIFQPDVQRLESFSGQGMELRNPEWSSERIEIGMLKGNRFTITMRDIALEEAEIRKRVQDCIEEMLSIGVPNYFGEQRFGGIRKITHLVGREFVKGDVENAVMLYLTSVVPEEEEGVKAARAALAESNDFGAALKNFDKKYRYERAIVGHLHTHPKDFAGAFRNLPKSMCYLFTHAYQSYLFNKTIDRRFEEGMGISKTDGDILVDGIPTAPLAGYETVFSDGKAGEIEKAVLEEEGVSLSEFKISSMPELSSRGARRQIALFPENPQIVSVGEDEFFEGKRFCTVSFSLSRGNYATTVMREIIKQ